MPWLPSIIGVPLNAAGSRGPYFFLRFAFWLALSLVIPDYVPTGRADEAILLDGTRRAGDLRFHEEKFTFISAGEASPLPWQKLDRVEPTRKPTVEPAMPFSWEATLTNGDRFACRLADIETNVLIADSSWFQGLRIRRTAIRSLERPQGWTNWLRQNLAKETRDWKETREMGEATPHTGIGSLELGPVVKVLEFTPDTPLPLGRISLQMRDMPPSQTRWQLQVGVDGDHRFQTLKVLFGGKPPCELQAPGLDVVRQDVQCAESVLLQLEISEHSLRLTINGRLAGWTKRGFPDAQLRSLSLRPEIPLVASSQARLTLQDFAVARRLGPLARPPMHPELDEVWLESGDQVFGNFRAMDAQGLELATALGVQRIPFNQVRGLYPRRIATRELQLPAPWQLALFDPSDPEPSRLTGLIRTWGEREIIMVHPLLGELKLPRSHVRAVAQAEQSPNVLGPNTKKAIKP
jgi:hypothetical protein